MHQIGDDESPATVGSVDLAGPAAQVVVGHDHACALLEDGTVQCWGAGSDGRLGYSNVNTIGDDETLATVGLVDVGGTVVQLTAGHLHTCGLLDTGAVRCWGYNGWGQLGYGNTEHIGDDETPATAGDVDVGGTAVQVSGGYGHTCALLDTGAVRCWGSPGDGLLGYGELEHIGDDETPATAGDVPLGGLVVQVSAGPSHTCAVMASGGVRCWGAGAGGRLGYPNIEDIGDDETPASVGDVPIDEDVVEVVTGSSNTCVLLASGAVRCWGQGYQGLNGQGDEADIGGHGLAPSSVDPVPISLPLFP
jgi:alpha-tubulin suppressor-like RCC1 family protein